MDVVLQEYVVKLNFNTYGITAYKFIFISAYRGGLITFAVISLSCKPFHVFAKPSYVCEWVPHYARGNFTVSGVKILPDWRYGRVCTTVIGNCTFLSSIGHYGSGGRLVVHASTAGGSDANFNLTDCVEALAETPRSLNPL